MFGSTVVVDDSFAGGRTNNGALQADWWTSTGNTAIEVGPGFPGLVSGSSGRGIHGTFAAQTLVNVGDVLTATFTFTTPLTVATGSSAGFRIGLFDTTGKPGLAADLSASGTTPNALYNNLSGYMMDFDVRNDGTADIALRERTNAGSGQLLAATGDYSFLSGGGASYVFAANTSYTGVFSIAKTAAGLDLTSSLYQGANLLSSHTASDNSASTYGSGMLAFHVGSNTFGSSSTVGAANNGLDFTNIQVAVTPVPEPAPFLMFAAGMGLLGFWKRKALRKS